MPSGSTLLRDRLQVLRRRAGTIVLVVVLAVGGAVAYALAQTPVYASSTKLLLEPRQTDSLLDPTAGLQLDPGRLVRNEVEVLKSEPVQEAVRQAIGSAPAVDVIGLGNTDVITIRAEDADPERAAVVANAYAQAYVSVRQQQAQDDLQTASQEVQAKVDDLQAQIDGLDRRVTQAPASQRESLRASLAPQRQELVSAQSLFRQRLDQLQVEAPLRSGGAEVVTTARASTDPVRPQPVKSGTVALVLGLMAGGGLAFVREHLDDTLKSKEDLEQAAGVPVVGLVPRVSKRKSRPRRGKPRVLSLDEPSSPAAEAYRTLRTSVQFLSLDRPMRTLMVTSPGAGEGKTTVTANLAVVLADAGVPVVVVDCDLRRPRIHEVFGMANEVGFTSVLLGDVTLEEAVQPVDGVDQLRVLVSGPIPPNPSELLDLKRTGDVLEKLASNGSLVLLDSPPVLPVTDAQVLGAKVDAALLVGVSGETNRRAVSRAVELLAQVQAPLVGTVLNAVTGEGGYSYAYFYAEGRGGRRRGSGKA